jgi:hypothetical protein
MRIGADAVAPDATGASLLLIEKQPVSRSDQTSGPSPKRV